MTDAINDILASSYRPENMDWSDAHDRELARKLRQREADWRVGPIVYQVYLDRFAPAKNLQQKITDGLYDTPRILRPWSTLPKRGPHIHSHNMSTNALEYWGGDLQSLHSRIGYLQSLSPDVIYLGPIHEALSNHKYDASDYFNIAPEYGSHDELHRLTEDIHGCGMRIMLDGVFNHMGQHSPYFIDAKNNPDSPYRDWFVFDDAYPSGYRSWMGSENLPELNLENPELRQLLWEDENSVIKSYLQNGIDGWRLDVAYDLGFNYLKQITDAAHAVKPDASVIGELWNYPSQWVDSHDGLINLHVRQIIYYLLQGKIIGRQAAACFKQMIDDMGYESLLKSWLVLDNHDVRRLRTDFTHESKRQLAQLLQFTLPGSPNMYYGSELGMLGGDDPACRAPMRWDLVHDSNPHLAYTKQLISLRKEHRALRVGETYVLHSEKCFAFARFTDRLDETLFVLVNPTAAHVTEMVQHRTPKIMSMTRLKDLLSPSSRRYETHIGFLEVSLPPHSAMILTPDVPTAPAYNPFKRVN
ncbi:alpha-amylase family glycosyl hydrolase [Poriferisphaera sp. WC338]|uniref:alpha-amylase family glycosyl hydrolase n=1 Tax=Poriferisphaera sp. WC338 TaxID=3425129 RepID=UPI003D81A50A